MKTENELKEILQQAYKDAGVDEFMGTWNFEKWHEKYSSKILALGKPEPLAKNKQCDDDFICGSEKRGYKRCETCCNDEGFGCW